MSKNNKLTCPYTKRSAFITLPYITYMLKNLTLSQCKNKTQ